MYAGSHENTFIDKIAYCYNSQLLAHPGIEGEVQIQFFIAPTGGVERSSGSKLTMSPFASTMPF